DDYFVDSDQSDPAGGPPVTTQVTTLPSPSLSISKAADPDHVTPGGLLTYMLTVRNDSATPATGVLVTDTLPADTSFFDCSGAPCFQESDSVVWTVGTLGANSQTSVTLVVKVLPATPGGTPIENLHYEVDSVQTNPVEGPPVVVQTAYV